MAKFLETLISLVLFSLVLFACSPGATPATPTQIPVASQVLIQGNRLAEETQTIELDNCDGKADAVRSEQRGQSVDVTVSAEVAAKLGVSVEVIQAEVQATVGAQVTDSGYRSSTIQLVAPPKTRMVFQIVWSGPEQVGIVQNLESVGVPIAFRRLSPTDVKIKSHLDIGCPVTPANNPQSFPTTVSQPTFQPIRATRIPALVQQPTLSAAAQVFAYGGQCSDIPINLRDDFSVDLDPNHWYLIEDYDNQTSPPLHSFYPLKGGVTVTANALRGQRAWECRSESAAYNESRINSIGYKQGNPNHRVIGPDGQEVN